MDVHIYNYVYMCTSLQLLSANTSQRRQPVKSSTVSPGPPHMGSSGNNPPTPGGSGWAAGGRKRPAKPPPSCEAEADGSNPKRRRTSASYSTRQSGEKQHNKGLRHFSQRVCEKVREKGTTTYNEVSSLLMCISVGMYVIVTSFDKERWNGLLRI